MAGILLIDDDVDRLDILAGMLRRAGYEVFASRPVDAAALHVNGQPSPGLAVAVMMARADRATAEASSTGAQAPAGPAAEAAAPAVATLPEGEAFECHAALRWARAVVALLGAQADPRTLQQWGRTIGAAAGTLRGWCRMAGLSAKSSLLLARLLRAVFQARSRGWSPEQLLDVVDRRTLARMLASGGLDHAPEGLTVHQFLARQSLVADRAALDTLRRLLAGGDGTTTVPTAVSTALPTPFSTAVAAPLPATVRTAALTSRRA